VNLLKFIRENTPLQWSSSGIASAASTMLKWQARDNCHLVSCCNIISYQNLLTTLLVRLWQWRWEKPVIILDNLHNFLTQLKLHDTNKKNEDNT